MAAKVTVDEVRRVAELAHLELTADETGSMLHDLNAILDYIAELNQLDTTGVAPLAQVTELNPLDGPAASFAATLRFDAIQPSLDRAAVLAQAPDANGVFFKVPRVMDR
jgi:aspartyl-tRNA(Asn)/glutamyl-tRNA(Gln) amidotransferase subunit C